jgi:membrane associated rhomboid family serine protease
MLEDRDYMRQPEYGEPRWRPRFRPRWSWTLALLVVNAIVFVVECILCGYPPALSEGNYFALSVEGIKHGYVWQFLTFQFMHAGLLHIFFNSWAIWVFGRHFEMEFGPRKFLTLYFTSGVIGGVVQIAGGLLWPDHFGTATVGASAGAMGLMAAFAALHPEAPLTIFFYFFPITTRAKFLVWGLALLSVLCILFPISLFTMILGGNVANAAHLGGMAMGWFYVSKILQHPALAGVPEKKQFTRPRPVAEEITTDQFMQSAVDPILEKISAHGIQSLTPRERDILEKARAKMQRR